MKVTRNWLQQYVSFELPPIDELVQKIGAQLGAVEAVLDLGARYKGVTVVKVVECLPHPNADKLKLCKIDDGNKFKDVPRDESGHISIVCGAPNVAEGLLVAWIPPGSIVPNTIQEDEPFTIEAREIRGEMSNGMLASPKELALGDSHEGLFILNADDEDSSAKPGDDFAESFGLNDYVIDIENKMFTHRPDCFGIIGIAREVSGILRKPFISPENYLELPKPEHSTGKKLDVINELPELVPRFVAQVFENVEIKASPAWLQIALAKVGARSINNIVDITNYYMLLTGQPLHAYDYDKLRTLDASDTATIIIRHPKENEHVKLLSGKTITPDKKSIVIASKTQAIGLGGVMGGEDTEVDSSTKNIVLESAQFDMYTIRRTSMNLGIFTDAVTRFSKGQSPLQSDRVLAMASQDIINIAHARASDYFDELNLDNDVIERQSLDQPLSIAPDFIYKRLGIELSDTVIENILSNVEFTVSKATGRNGLLHISAPFWRTDIELPEDIVEEVGRLYGYDKLKLVLPDREILPANKNLLLSMKAQIRNILSSGGANEVLTYSFVHRELMDKVGQDTQKAFQIDNALSPDLQFYRISLMPSLLDKVHMNTKAGYREFALFEIGKTHDIDHFTKDNIPDEFEFTALVVTADDRQKKNASAYYEAKAYLESLVGDTELVYEPINESMLVFPVAKPYDPRRTASVKTSSGEFLGIIGEFRLSVRTALKLPRYTAGFELDTRALEKIMLSPQGYIPLPKFPSVNQDMTLEVAATLPYAQLREAVNKAYAFHAIENTNIALELIDIFQKPDDQDNKHVTFRFTTTGEDRTLTDKMVTEMLDKVAESLQTEINARRI